MKSVRFLNCPRRKRETSKATWLKLGVLKVSMIFAFQVPAVAQTVPVALIQPKLIIHQAHDSNTPYVDDSTTANYTVIDDPRANNNPAAILIVTPVWNPDARPSSGRYNPHTIGVSYTGSRWAIVNQDGASMPIGAAFNVLIDNFGNIHRAPPPEKYPYYTPIDDPRLNNNPNATVLVTLNVTPGGKAGASNSHPLGVWYTGSRWVIFNQDYAPMPANAAFNYVIRQGSVYRATSGTSSSMVITHPLADYNANASLSVTQNAGQSPTPVTNSHSFTVRYTGSRWAIFNQDGAAIPLGAAFNVSVTTPHAFVHHVIPDGPEANVRSGRSYISDYLLDNNPFVTPMAMAQRPSNLRDFGSVYFGYADLPLSGYPQFENKWFLDLKYGPFYYGDKINVIVGNTFSQWIHSWWNTETINHPLLNYNPNAVLTVSPASEFYGGPIAVRYNGQNWEIVAMDGWQFNGNTITVMMDNGFVHQTPSAGNSWTYFSHPLADNNPNAVVIVTPNVTNGVRNLHFVGVGYDASLARWYIYNQDGANIPFGAAFNVKVYLRN
jgi:hypothetical protein